MSDNENYSDSNNSESDNDSSDEENVVTTSKKPVILKPLTNIDAYEEDSEEEVEAEEDDDNIELVGGAEDEYEIEGDNIEDDDDDDDIDIDGDENEDNIISSNKKKSSNKTKKVIPLVIDSDEEEEEDDEDDDEDENYLQKFDSEITKNYINDFHPECLTHNYDEIAALSKVVRDSDNIIIDPLHRTVPFLTKYEKARILGQRAKQIESGAKPLVKVPENVIDGYIIAELELQQKRIPFIIRRPLPNGASEYWNLKDLEMISF